MLPIRQTFGQTLGQTMWQSFEQTFGHTKKSHIRETLNLLTDVDGSTDKKQTERDNFFSSVGGSNYLFCFEVGIK